MDSYLLVLNRLCEDVQKSMANKPFNGDIDWDVSVEILLFYAMIGHKPVGVNRYYMMTCIHDKFSSYINKQMSSKPLWDHLDSMYDMGALHESEIIPFPNDEVNFELPVHDFGSIAKEKYGYDLPVSEKVDTKTNVDKLGKRSGTFKSMRSRDQTVSKIGSNVAVKANISSVKSESTVDVSSSGSKGKQDSTMLRTGKVKPATSPSVKVIKTEVLTPTKSLTNADVTAKKMPKQEPASTTGKRIDKLEVNDSEKKNREILSTNVKKNNKTNTPISSSKRNSGKTNETSILKRKSDSESSGKRSNEPSPSKPNQKTVSKKAQSSPQKYVRGDDTDSQSSVGSSKSGRGQSRYEQGDRKRRFKNDDLLSPKGTPTKRRRN